MVFVQQFVLLFVPFESSSLAAALKTHLSSKCNWHNQLLVGLSPIPIIYIKSPERNHSFIIYISFLFKILKNLLGWKIEKGTSGEHLLVPVLQGCCSGRCRCPLIFFKKRKTGDEGKIKASFGSCSSKHINEMTASKINNEIWTIDDPFSFTTPDFRHVHTLWS